MSTFVFSSKEELLEQAEKDRACEEGLLWANDKDSLESILKEIPIKYRIWCLKQGYYQFLDDCVWEELDGWYWSNLLSSQPQFSEFCIWGKLSGFNWSILLSEQPQLSKFCSYWENLDGWDWSNLLYYQPQFSEYCDWKKLIVLDWTYLLSKQPQFEIFR